MLVLNRKVGEKICIDGQITVIVNRIQGNRVSLAIEAPSDIHVVRGELRPFVKGLSSDSLVAEAPPILEPLPEQSGAENSTRSANPTLASH